MEPSTAAGNIFLERLSQEVENNLTNDQFGVEELSKCMGMSRSQLHRKLVATTGQSISQYIREYRLQRGMELLRTTDLTAAEIGDRVGFGSATYFNKCFTEYYGFPPGEAKKQILTGLEEKLQLPTEPQMEPPVVKSLSWKLLTAASTLVVIIALLIYFGNREKRPTRNAKAIAILPFKNLSADKRNEYFSEGVVEAIRTGLSQVNDLKVISRTSVEQYRQTPKLASEIAAELGVSTLLEGSIQRNGEQVRVEVRLVDGESEALLWAQTYDRELKDVFAIQNEIAKKVADELNAKLSPEEKSKLSRAETDNPKAYDLYLKAKYEYRTYTNKGAHNSIDLLSEAITLDPNYARAYASLASSYIGLATIWGAELSAIEALRKGKPLIEKALEIDPDLDEAHVLMGFYKLYHDWDFAAAEAAYKSGITDDNPDGLAVYVDFLNFMRRHEEALQYAERLNERDPYYPNSRMTFSYIYNGRFDDALEFSERRLQMFSNYSTFDNHGFLLLNMGRYQDAIVYFEKAIALEGIRYPRMLGWMGAAYAKSGNVDEAQKIIAELKHRLQKNEKGSIAFFIAVIYSAMNEKDLALQWLKTAHASHDMEMPWLMTEPQFYTLHQDNRFTEIARQMGF